MLKPECHPDGCVLSCRLQVVALNKRSKEAESAFLGIYKQLIEAPDPVPVLEATHTLEERLQQLQSSAPNSEALVREISGHWKRHLECLDKPGDTEEDPAAAESGPGEASSWTAGVMTPNSKQALRVTGSPQQNHQGQNQTEGLETQAWEAEDTDATLADRLGEAEERIKVLHSSLSTAQTDLLDLRCKYDQEKANNPMRVVHYIGNRVPFRMLLGCDSPTNAGGWMGELCVGLLCLTARALPCQASRRMASFKDCFRKHSTLSWICERYVSSSTVEMNEYILYGLSDEWVLSSAACDRLIETLNTPLVHYHHYLSVLISVALFVKYFYSVSMDVTQSLVNVPFLSPFLLASQLGLTQSRQTQGLYKALLLKTKRSSKRKGRLCLVFFTVEIKFICCLVGLMRQWIAGGSKPWPPSDTAEAFLRDKEAFLPSPKYLMDKARIVHNNDEDRSEESGRESDREWGRPSGPGPPTMDVSSSSHDLPRPFSVSPCSRDRLSADHVVHKQLLSSPLFKKESGSPLMAFPTALYAAKVTLMSANQGPAGAGGIEAGLPSDQSESGSSTAGDDDQLETAEIAFQVKEQLLKHNIGQRVFGHYVLGLSQGSVSEILARPKPWRKLTVKGKEPFIKMKQFLSDDQNILALRTIQVRQRGSITPRIRTPETGSDDAIKNILEQAKKEIQSQRGGVSGTGDIKSSLGSPSGLSSNGAGGSSDDTIKNILEQARREMQAQQQALMEMDVCGRASATSAGPQVERLGLPEPSKVLPLPTFIKQEEGGTVTVCMANPISSPQTPLSVLSPAAFVQNIIRKVKSEIGEAGTYFDQHWSVERGPIGMVGGVGGGSSRPFTSVSPSLSSSSSSGPSALPRPWPRLENGECLPNSEEASAAEEDTGSGMVRSVEVKVESDVSVSGESPGPGRGLSYYPSYLPRTLKPTVPPLTPEQYEMYMYHEVDTIELTRQVKEKLAKNGICQRIFGEKVLGLSQGSVSDMLSRPKPWSKLTQKGREPFIRMQLWLLDQLGQALTQLPSQSLSRDKSPVTAQSSPSPPPSPEESHPSPLVEPVSHTLESSKENQQPDGLGLMPPHPEGGKSTPSLLSLHQPHTPLGIQELVAMSPELDTYAITKKVKEVLTDNNLGQRLFGESILGLTQGSVSDLLSRPKPWHKLSLKGREPFVRMQLWLNDPHNVDKLRDMKKMEKKAYLKRRYGLLSTGSDSDSPSARSECVSPALASIDLCPYSQVKKPRVVLGAEEKEALRKAYLLEPYPSQHTIEMLACQLNLKTNTVINWFHNYSRSRMRREVLMEGLQDNDTDTEHHSYSPSAIQSPISDGDERRLLHPAGRTPHPIRPLSANTPLPHVKQEASEREDEGEEEERNGYIKQPKIQCFSMGVQFPQLKTEHEDLMDGPQRNSQSRHEVDDSSKSPVDPVSFKASSEPSRSSLEVSLNSPSAASSPGLMMSVSPVSSSSAPISPSLPNPPTTSTNHSLDPNPMPPIQSPKPNRSVQRRTEKIANLNNIIHRLERAANREETLEWEF
ncbi:unnamed protein product [Oncorhynchus mykiss]|uniref:Homeobox protein cut-like n=1 Tax=Oncorhynchus mykiss TaxID=8022 RepID=A0A060WV66_ONCMY|nr:unnamed protein product [Oncorhynchus mykiss]